MFEVILTTCVYSPASSASLMKSASTFIGKMDDVWWLMDDVIHLEYRFASWIKLDHSLFECMDITLQDLLLQRLRHLTIVIRQRGQVSVLRTKCGESLLFLYLSSAPADEARLHSLLVPKIFLLLYCHPTVGMKYYWSHQSCLLSSTISGRQMVYGVMNLLYPNKTHHLPVVRWPM